MSDFLNLVKARQSDRAYEPGRKIEREKLERILEAARLAPSACNGQPWNFTVITEEPLLQEVGKATASLGMNKFAKDAPILIVISEEDYVPSAALGARVKKNDYRSIDIGILSAYITAEACAQGLGSCILGWFDDEKIRNICNLTKPVRLVITLGYPTSQDTLRTKKRKEISDIVSYK